MVMIRSVLSLFMVLALSTQGSALRLKSELQYAIKFTQWLGSWNITYTNDMLDHRFGTFKTNYDFVEDHNDRFEKGLETFTMALNEAADLTSEEYFSRMGLKAKAKTEEQQLLKASSNTTDNVTDLGAPKLGSVVDILGWVCEKFPVPVLCKGLKSTAEVTPAIEARPELALQTAIPHRVDWRERGVISPIKNQGPCGSCWAFGAVSTMEAVWARKSGRLIQFSEQEQLDCAANGMNTCETGGLMEDAFNWSIENPPMPDFRYQYTGTDRESCKYRSSGATDARFKNVVTIPAGSEIALQAAVAYIPSVSVAIDASLPSFQFYSSGVYTDSSCSNEESGLNHAVNVVGYGTDSLTGQDYWLVRNSWSENWGDKGYIRMRRNYKNQCGIAHLAQYITV